MILYSGFKLDRSITGDIMLTLATLLVRNEFCEVVDNAGGLKFLLDVMIDHPDVEKLNVQSLKLMKALAGNDNVKARIVTAGSAPLIVSAISRLKVSFPFHSDCLCCKIICKSRLEYVLIRKYLFFFL